MLDSKSADWWLLHLERPRVNNLGDWGSVAKTVRLATPGEGDRPRGWAPTEDDLGLVRRKRSGVPKYFRVSSAIETNLDFLAKRLPEGQSLWSIWAACSLEICGEQKRPKAEWARFGACIFMVSWITLFIGLSLAFIPISYLLCIQGIKAWQNTCQLNMRYTRFLKFLEISKVAKIWGLGIFLEITIPVVFTVHQYFWTVKENFQTFYFLTSKILTKRIKLRYLWCEAD